MSVAMQFGRAPTTVQNRSGMALITEGEITDETVDTLEFEEGGFYVLYTKESNASSGAYRGHHAIAIAAPEEALFGTVAVAHGNMYASANSGVTITYATDSTVTIARSSATYAVRYALYRVF